MVLCKAAGGTVSADLVVQTVISDLDITFPGVAAGPFVHIDDVIIFQLKRGQRRAPAKKDSALGAINYDPALSDEGSGGVDFTARWFGSQGDYVLVFAIHTVLNHRICHSERTTTWHIDRATLKALLAQQTDLFQNGL